MSSIKILHFHICLPLFVILDIFVVKLLQLSSGGLGVGGMRQHHLPQWERHNMSI